MVYALEYTAQFKKDYKLARKRGRNMSKLEETLRLLCAGQALPEAMRDHQLVGNYRGHRECHIEPDWLLIYRIDGANLILTATRTGTHADLLGI